MTELVRSGATSTTQLENATPNKEHRDILISCNIFLMDNLKKQVTFQSRPVELYMRAETGVFEEQCNATTD